MTYDPRKSREHARMVERLLALAEAYGCDDLESMRVDVETVIRVEYLTFHRAVRSAEERWRRRLAVGRNGHQPVSDSP